MLWVCRFIYVCNNSEEKEIYVGRVLLREGITTSYSGFKQIPNFLKKPMMDL